MLFKEWWWLFPSDSNISSCEKPFSGIPVIFLSSAAEKRSRGRIGPGSVHSNFLAFVTAVMSQTSQPLVSEEDDGMPAMYVTRVYIS